ncbi:MAG TPA: methylated-DNA--[protein]-cysteine S-methyltransferase [Candidatus Paceibacterota bacterium]|nr:methylated-DNA--[protein]-cysteine S-methyltransferase [Verrucomicrobiota bacterium]HRY51121.1 methylated-DNA--[protein]-cysteine S-methyltransferase [Candidatus Paceibacterota bacterium]HSA02273.1 methylated-DNA--[protein]-cysteine S-methyltransferase [Candidatus Paceibacterota bacterium]
MSTIDIHTDEGVFRAQFTEHGLSRLVFPRGHLVPPISANRGSCHAPDLWLRQTREAVRHALRGRQPDRLPPLDLSAGSPFQQEVWQFLLTIPAGETRTYGEVAEALDRPGTARAVGQACGANPIPVLIPCHRVLGARGSLGGFSAGLRWKRLLLEREGVSVNVLTPDSHLQERRIPWTQ